MRARKTSRVRLFIVLALLLLLPLIVWLMSGYIPNTLYFDSNGVAHGSGTRQYFYESGALMLADRYVAGQLIEETWYKPDGTIIANERFKDGCGTGYYLREDGSIRVKMTYMNGMAHGPATYYTESGEIDKVVSFVNGQVSGGE